MDAQDHTQIKYLILLDFQATCAQNQQLKPCSQIIEMTGSIMYLDTKKHTNNFHTFLKPSCNPKLTQFCKQYTSISQNQIKTGISLQTGLKNLCQWFKAHDFLQPNNYIIGTWVDWQMKCLQKECKIKKLQIPHFIHSFVSLKRLCESILNKKGSLEVVGQGQKDEEMTKGKHNIENLFQVCLKLLNQNKTVFEEQRNRTIIKQIPDVTISSELKYLLVLDFEATCEDNVKLEPCSQIIQLPVLIVDIEKLMVIEKFHEYVTPKFNKKLTKFCTQLTGITQQMVNDKMMLEQVLQKFNKWMQNLPYLHSRNFTFVTCGDWDLCSCLKKECRVKNIEQPQYMKNYINVKKAFQKTVPEYDRSMGMMGMLKALNIAHEGRHHSGIDDVKNICNISIELMKKGFKFDRKFINYVK